MIVERLAVVGLGLIGGSVALGARRRNLAGSISGWDLDPGAVLAAEDAGAVDCPAASLAEAVAGADLVLLAVPVLALERLALEARRLAPATAVLTDAGSTKGSLARALDALPGSGPVFVGGHPIAGREDAGFAAASGDLFENAAFILTPTENTPPAAADLVASFWAGLGARVHRLSPAEHDRLFAFISHLPHLAAYALVHAVFGGVGDPGLMRTYAGGGFRDFTRIAASDAVMWRDICLDNRDELLRALDLFEGELATLRGFLAAGDDEGLRRYFEGSRALRRSL